MKTPDAEWEKELKKFRLNYPVTTGYGATDVVFNMEDVIKKFIQELLSSRDTYWKERVRKEKLGWEGYVVVDPQSNNYKCSPIFFSVKEAEKWRRDFGESALRVATVDVILKN